MAANWRADGASAPQLTTSYTDIIDSIRERDEDVAKQFNNPSGNALLGSNHVTGTIRWDGANNKWLYFDGTDWDAPLSTAYDINVATVVSCAPNNAAGANNLARNNDTLQNELVAEFLGTNSKNAAYYENATNLATGTVPTGRLTGTYAISVSGNAATFTVADNSSTNATFYPLIADGATGTQGAATDSALTYNPSSGLLTTTTVAANLTGNVTGNSAGTHTGAVVGNATTATALATPRTIALSGDVDATGVAFDGSGNISLTTTIDSNTVDNAELVNNSNIQLGGLGIGTAGASGEVRATGTITAHYSDERLKIKTGIINNALDKVNSLTGFKYIENSLANSLGFTTGENFVGVSAQELQKVLPEAVKPAPFDLSENNKSISGENYLTVQYEKIVPLLVESIKELKYLVDYQASEIEDLKAQQKFTS
jgi:hypothetical protein